MNSTCNKFLLLSFIVAAFFVSCRDSALQPEASANIKQVGKCNGSGLLKSTQSDSCFVYSFSNVLTIDFCVIGNCCPDSNRFTSTYSLTNDEITIKIKDTAPNLCKCLCRYIIHAEFYDLDSGSYKVICIDGTNNGNKILYSKLVLRKL